MIIDSNIIIGYLNGDEAIISSLNQLKADFIQLYIPAIVEAEVLSFPELTQKEEHLITNFIEDNFILIPFTRDLIRLTAALRRKYKIKFPDATIAATAIHEKLPLITRNIKDFRNIDGLKLIKI